MVTADDDIYISKSRKPCEQLFQRLMITYDGKLGCVAMIGAPDIVWVMLMKKHLLKKVK